MKICWLWIKFVFDEIKVPRFNNTMDPLKFSLSLQGLSENIKTTLLAKALIYLTYESSREGSTFPFCQRKLSFQFHSTNQSSAFPQLKKAQEKAKLSLSFNEGSGFSFTQPIIAQLSLNWWKIKRKLNFLSRKAKLSLPFPRQPYNCCTCSLASPCPTLRI